MKVYKEDYTVLGAEMGRENPYPSFRLLEFSKTYDCDALNVPLEERDTLGYEIGWRVLPYRTQDRYNTAEKPKTFDSVVIENEILKVRVLPELGGLVADVFHKPLKKELIYRNPVFQPRNLALRDAWVSGGIEFNTAQLGHHYLTCSPLHTAIVKDGDEEFVRIFAWERVKAFPYQIDLHLPDGSPFLFMHIKVINTHDYVLPMYWWTNIGMEEFPGGRVIAPCTSTYETHQDALRVVDCPIIDGIDKSYVTNMKSAYDLFFRIPKEKRKWEVLVDREGEGLLHVATDQLKSTKVFAWGTNPGSCHWSEYLSQEGYKPFQEIQFGLAPSQMHSEKMPEKTVWEWTEAISYFKGDKNILHGDWTEAYTYGTSVVDEMLSREELDDYDRKYKLAGEIIPEKILHKGLGWGALEQEMRKSFMGEDTDTPIPPYMPFEESDMGEEQKDWLELLRTGSFPERDPLGDIGHYMIQPQWEYLLEKSINEGKSNNWTAWFHLGIMKREKPDTSPHAKYSVCIEEAEKCFMKSIELCPSPYAYAALAQLYKNLKDEEKSFEYTLKAYEWGKDETEIDHASYIAPGIMKTYLDKGQPEKAKEFYDSLRDETKNSERVRLQWGFTAFELGLTEEVEKVLDSRFDNIAEGEMSVTGLWYKYYAKKIAQRDGVEYNEEFLDEIKNSVDPPHDLDFRMFVGDGVYVPPSER
ncbi:MAG: DUF5107 domain-containing protein [Armatimonadetes bacterium]|nr:DUF5107 domain-containing protein [Candidatus Hippobium faecium]